MPSGTSSDTVIKDVATTVENQLFPALTQLLEQYGSTQQQLQQSGAQQQGAHGQSSQWAQPAFQVKQACDELVQMISRANVDQIGRLRLPQMIQQQPGGEQYAGE